MGSFKDLFGSFGSPEYAETLQRGIGTVGPAMSEQVRRRQEEKKAARDKKRLDFAKDLSAYKAGLKEVTPELLEEGDIGTITSLGGDPYTKRTDFETADMKDIMLINQRTGEMENVGSVPKDTRILARKEPIKIAKEKAAIKEKGDLRKAFFASTGDFTVVGQALDHLERTSKELEEFRPGVLNQILDKTKFALGSFGQEEHIAKYLASIEGSLALFARKVMGERGVLTNQDVERARKMLGNETAPLSTKLSLLGELRTKARKNMENTLANAGIEQEELKTTNPSFYCSMGGDDWWNTWVSREAKKAASKKSPAIKSRDSLADKYGIKLKED